MPAIGRLARLASGGLTALDDKTFVALSGEERCAMRARFPMRLRTQHLGHISIYVRNTSYEERDYVYDMHNSKDNYETTNFMPSGIGLRCYERKASFNCIR